MKTRNLILSLAGAACLIPAITLADEKGGIRQEAREKLTALRDELNLDPAQKKEIREVLVSHKPELIAQFTQGKNAREAMQSAVKDHGAASPEANAAATNVGEVAKKRALLVASISEQVKPILTPDQIKKLQDAKAGFRKWLQEEMVAGKS